VDVQSLWPVLMLALAAFGVAFAAMAIGVMLSGRCLRGSCGGPEAAGPKGERLSCAGCPNRGKRANPPGQSGWRSTAPVASTSARGAAGVARRSGMHATDAGRSAG